MSASLKYIWLGLFALLSVGAVVATVYKTMQSPRLTEIRQRVEPDLRTRLTEAGLAYGAPAYIRIHKEELELELWLKPKGRTKYQHWHTWPVVAMSGTLGPKQKEGDRQAPEGFYGTNASLLNPNSKYHLSFNIGYPNAHDRAHGRTGNFLMVHGNQVSLGCFAMTDPVIEEIYLLVEAAILAGQKEVPVHIYPFRMTDERMARVAGKGQTRGTGQGKENDSSDPEAGEAESANNGQGKTDAAVAAEEEENNEDAPSAPALSSEEAQWLPFWQDLQRPWHHFETTHTPPVVRLSGGRYVLGDGK